MSTLRFLTAVICVGIVPATALSKDAGERSESYQAALSLFRQKQFNAAETLLANCRAEFGDSIPVVSASAFCAQQLGKDKQSIDLYKRLLLLADGREALSEAEEKHVDAGRKALRKLDPAAVVLYEHALQLREQAETLQGSGRELVLSGADALLNQAFNNEPDHLGETNEQAPDNGDTAGRGNDPVETNEAQPDFKEIARNSAGVRVVNANPRPLRVSNHEKGWHRVPESLLKHRAIIFSNESGKTNGVVDFEVLKTGYVLLACDYSYQGNQSGNWVEERWTSDDFVNNGWKHFTEQMMGGLLVSAKGKRFDVFMKKLKQGEKLRLRCNKYLAPIVIVFP